MKVTHLYPQIISIEHLFQAWDEFKKGKRKRKDVQIFERNLEDNLFLLHEQLKNKTYKHSPYTAFNIYDPKFRHIHKAIVLDRVVHHAVVSKLEPIFDKTFIFESYSCRKNKGMHRAVMRLAIFARRVSQNYQEPCFVLKLDIKKFFASVDHKILLGFLQERIRDPDFIWLMTEIISSFHSEFGQNKGIPIGNLTSQIFANIYLHELDKFIKEDLKIKHYIRYADDFVIISGKRTDLNRYLKLITSFLDDRLKLKLHQGKIIFRKLNRGIDFLGYIVLPHYILPRTKTRRRIFKKLEEKRKLPNFNQTLQSYLGYLKHASSFKLQQCLTNHLYRCLENYYLLLLNFPECLTKIWRLNY